MRLMISASSTCALTGIEMPSILMLTGAPTEKKRSEACFSAASCSNGVTIIVNSFKRIEERGLRIGGNRSSAQSSIPDPELDASQQLVDAHLRQGFGIHFLHDHRAVQTVAAVCGRQVAADHHRSGGHAAIAHLAGFAVVNLGTLTDEHAHRDHAVVFDDYAFHHFRACADEAVVEDNSVISMGVFIGQ